LCEEKSESCGSLMKTSRELFVASNVKGNA
jgi:hypothetical protein